ncbi:MAG: hypothetical protein ACYTF6_14590 [Planctomycetota bacterium]|jgi:hypothetical protein
MICLVTAVGGSLAAAKDCRPETPIPSDTELIAPAGNVPDEIARFAGVWNGAWRDRDACTNLVVEELHPNGFVRIVYSYGAYEPRDVPRVGFFRTTGRIVDGGLRLTAPNGVDLTYRLDGKDGLHATRTDGGPGTLSKVGSLAEVGCRPVAAKASDSGGGPRARPVRGSGSPRRSCWTSDSSLPVRCATAISRRRATPGRPGTYSPAC